MSKGKNMVGGRRFGVGRARDQFQDASCEF